MNLDNAWEELVDAVKNERIIRTKAIQKKKEKVKTDWSPQTYVDEFLSMKCCGDVLNVCNPIGKNARKEITESMALIKRVKTLALSHRRKYNVLDLCAGNALTSVLAVHLLPVEYAVAIDKRPRERQWDKVERFIYRNEDIFDLEFSFYIKGTKPACPESGFLLNKYINRDTIIVSSHPCGELARRIIEIYKNSPAKALFMLPCCYGKLHRNYPQELFTKMSKDWVWCYDLAQDIDAKMSKDIKCISPRNIMLSHIR